MPSITHPGPLLLRAALSVAAVLSSALNASTPEPLTALLGDPRPGVASSHPAGFVKLGNKVYFSANDGVLGRELWRSDGTPEGTVMVADIYPGVLGSNPEHLVVLDNRSTVKVTERVTLGPQRLARLNDRSRYWAERTLVWAQIGQFNPGYRC